MRTPTTEEIAQIKRLAQDEETSDTYYSDMMPIVLEHVNEHITTAPFTDDYTMLPGTVKLFIAQAIKFFVNAEFGLKSESIRSVSFHYDYTTLPSVVTDLLAKYGYSVTKRVTFFPAW